MSTFEIITIILLALTAIGSIIAIVLGITGRQKTVSQITSNADRNLNDLMRHNESESDALRENLRTDIGESRRETIEQINGSREQTVGFIASSFRQYGDLVANNQNTQAEQQDKRLTEINTTLSKYTMESEQKLENIRQSMDEKLEGVRKTTDEKLEGVRRTTDEKLESVRQATMTQIGELTAKNSEQLEQMRQTVDEKLQKTLESRIGESFRLVTERLEAVHKGLGEMQTLAAGVGDLKKVLTNVKTRGILGEVQLGNILEQILAPEQYETNVATKPGSSEVVEFAVKLPGNTGDGFVYLPIDAKFPGDLYERLLDAYDTADHDQVEAAAKELERRIKAEAKDIRNKYIYPPNTTDFGILFLPVEGLYAEVVRRGLLEELQREYKVNIAGPTTMAALLNSLQMGFRTLAIEKHTSEVWETLGAVKTEFEKFEGILEKAQRNLTDAGKNLDTLIGTRSRAIKRKLRGVESLEDTRSMQLLGTDDLSILETADDEDA